MRIHDISPFLNEKTPVFPGDQGFERQVLLEIHRGDPIDLSWIKSTVHIGAHADAPSHYHREGASIDKRDLSLYVGDCQVIEVRALEPRRLLPSDLRGEKILASRILFKTMSFRHDQPFQSTFCSLSPELIEVLAGEGVRLVGIDTPSVDPADSKDLPSHAALYRNDFAVLEGLDLDQVAPGVYELIALPLKLENADASPVRAILLER
jgi:arylformamidase